MLGRYVRDQNVLSWPEAIRKMTGLPATIVGLTDRGYLAPGMAADVTVFDPETILDRATFKEPTLRSEGIRYVLVNGEIAVSAGAPTGVAAGRPLRRASYMPTRPETTGDRRIAGRAVLGGITLKVDVSQAAGRPRAVGHLSMFGPKRRQLIASLELGLLQRKGNWYALSGVVRGGDYDKEAVTVIVDDADPTQPGRYILHVLARDGEIFRAPFQPASR